MDNQITQDGFLTADEYNQQPETKQLALFEMEEIAVRNTTSIDELQEQLKAVKEVLDDSYKQSSEYQTHKAELDVATSKLKQIQSQMRRLPEVMTVESKLAELKNEVKEKKAIVSNYAFEIARQKGTNEIVRDGVRYEIKTVAKLVRVK